MQKFQRFNVAIGGILAVLILVVGWLLDLPEGWPRLAVLAVAVLAFGLCAWAWKPKPPASGSAYSFVLPLLFLLNFNLSGWWLLVLLLVAVWAWALSRKSSGDYDFTPGLALGAALLVTLACLVGVAFGWVMA